MFESSRVFLVEERETLVVSEHMGKIGLNIFALTLIADVEGGNSKIWFEGLVCRIIKCMVRSVVPESGILIAIMSKRWFVFDGMLPNGQVEGIGWDVEVEPFVFGAAWAFGAVGRWFGLSFDVPSLGVETIVKFEANSLSPSVMQLVFNKHLKIDVTVIGEVNQLDLKEVPVVKSEVKSVDLLIQTQPSKWRTRFQTSLWKFELR